MGKENRLYSISLGVASLQGGSVGVATALSPATCRPFQVFSPSFFVGLGLTLTEEAFNDCIDHGPKAYFLTCQAVGRQMAEQRSGKIINLSTTHTRIGSGESTGSSAAYSSIDSMTRAIAQALGYYGVNVNCLVCEPMHSFSGTADDRAERLRRIPMGRLGTPEDLVGAAIFLATDDSNFVAGEALYVDGGYSNAAVTEDSFRPVWARPWGEFKVPPRDK